MFLLCIHYFLVFLPWCHIWLVFHVPRIPLGECYAGVSPQNFISMHPKMSCWIKIWFIFSSCSCLFAFFSWCSPFAAKRVFVDVGVLIFFIKIYCLRRMFDGYGYQVDYIFSGVVYMARLYSTSTISSCVGMDFLSRLKPNWVALMCCS